MSDQLGEIFAAQYEMMNGATQHMPEILLCVGGPLHGEQVVQKGHYFRAPVPLSNQWAAELSIFSTSYEKDFVEVRYGALTLMGYFWRWRGMDRGKATFAALGLIMASTIQGGR